MTALRHHGTTKPVTNWLRGPIYAMDKRDEYFWQKREEQKPRCYGYGRR